MRDCGLLKTQKHNLAYSMDHITQLEYCLQVGIQKSSEILLKYIYSLGNSADIQHILIRTMPTLFSSNIKLNLFMKFFERDDGALDDDFVPVKFETMLQHESLDLFSDRKFHLIPKTI